MSGWKHFVPAKFARRLSLPTEVQAKANPAAIEWIHLEIHHLVSSIVTLVAMVRVVCGAIYEMNYVRVKCSIPAKFARRSSLPTEVQAKANPAAIEWMHLETHHLASRIVTLMAVVRFVCGVVHVYEMKCARVKMLHSSRVCSEVEPTYRGPSQKKPSWNRIITAREIPSRKWQKNSGTNRLVELHVPALTVWHVSMICYQK